MTYEQIKKANDEIKATEINKKDYAEVHQRIKAFRKCCPNGTINTEILSIENGTVIFRATVVDEDGRLLGTGTAYEKENSTFINKTSYIENCETSAVGRALGMCGFGIDVSVASYEEVANAIEQQKAPKVEGEIVKKTPREKKAEPSKATGYPPRDVMMEVVKRRYPEGSNNLDALLKNNNLNSIDDMTDAQVMAVYNRCGGR